MEAGILSLIPAVTAVVLAFLFKEAIFSLTIACIMGVLIAGNGLKGVPETMIGAIGKGGFAWLLLVIVFIGILVAFLQKSGALQSFSIRIRKKAYSRNHSQFIAWLLGLFIFYADYFSALFVGPVLRDMTDRAKISREKFAYIVDSTAAPVCTIIPITTWVVYIVGILVGLEYVGDQAAASSLFLNSIPFNFYSLLAVIMVAVIAIGLLPDFGPMKKAEKRAMEKGLLLAEGATPMMGKELIDIQPKEGANPNLFITFFFPVILLVSVSVLSYFITGTPWILESFMIAVAFLGVTLRIQGLANFKEIMDTAINGVKGIVPAVIITALAYTLNDVTKELGTADYVISLTKSWATPTFIMLLAFIVSGFISFFTGTSWGTFAIMLPIAIPMAFDYTGGETTTLVYATLAAVTGGGVFGDHCSPLSDTTILSSLGCACDHMDHVKTQAPYALCVGGVAALFYVFIGFIV